MKEPAGAAASARRNASWVCGEVGKRKRKDVPSFMVAMVCHGDASRQPRTHRRVTAGSADRRGVRAGAKRLTPSPSVAGLRNPGAALFPYDVWLVGSTLAGAVVPTLFLCPCAAGSRR